ncbi:MAG: OPT/YSL family transporter [Proteobacteria bacterium]|nr:OPT/YSL family transporter [Pseudomonadota bacterium]
MSDEGDSPLPPSATGPLKGAITPKVIVGGILVAVLMGGAYPYMVLKLGFGPNVSVVAAFFGFMFLRLFDLGSKNPEYSRWQNNLVEAAGTSASQTAFMCVLLGAFDLLKHHSGGKFSMELSPLDSFLWLTCASTLGVLLAVPLRRHFIVDEKLPYVDGLSAAETIIVLDPPRDASAEIKANAIAAFKAVMWGVVLSGMLMLFREDSGLVSGHLVLGFDLPSIPEGWNIPGGYFEGWSLGFDGNGWPMILTHGVILANLGVGFSYSLLSIGSGMIVGLRINVSMMLGGVLAWVIAPYFLIKYGVEVHHATSEVAGKTVEVMVATDSPSRTEVLFWVMWPATGMLVAGGLTALALRWKILVETFRSLRSAKISGDELPLSFIGIGILVSATALCIVQAVLLNMPVWMTIAAILLSIPLMLVGLRVLGETNWGPISALSNMMQGVFAALAPGNVVANMVASGTTGTIATSSEAIMQDYKAGDIIGTKPRQLTIMQLLAVPIGAASVSLVYPLLVKLYGIFDTVDPVTHEVIKKASLTSPISNKWSGFAQILKEGISALPASALYALAIFSVLGVAFTVAESNKKLKQYVPSPTGIGIGILVPFNVVATMFVGGLVGTVWERQHKRSADLFMVPLASGLIAGEAIVAVFGAIFLFIMG